MDRNSSQRDDFSRSALAAVGRLISAADDVRDGGPTAGRGDRYAFWQRQYAGAPQIIGFQVLFNRVPMTVIGVTPPAFLGVIVGRFVRHRGSVSSAAGAHVIDAVSGRRAMVAGHDTAEAGQSLQEATTAIEAAQPAIRAGSIPRPRATATHS